MSLLDFVGVSLVIVATPGPDTALTIRNALGFGGRAGAATIGGIVAGQSCWALAASLGLRAALNAFHDFFLALKYIGAAYLFYLEGRTLQSAFQGKSRKLESIRGLNPGMGRPHSAFIQGLLSNLSNPKMLLFFSTLLPLFVRDTEPSVLNQLLLLSALFSAITFGWLSLYLAGLRAACRFIQRRGVQRAIESLTGVALMGLAVRIAVDVE